MDDRDEFERYNAENHPGFSRTGDQYRLTAADRFALRTLERPDTELLALTRKDTGQLVVTSGRLAVFDPLWPMEQWSDPLDLTVPNGAHDAYILTCEAGKWGECNAMFVVTFEGAQPVEWTAASFASSLKYAPDEPTHLIYVDAGTIGLGDLSSIDNLRNIVKRRIEAGEIGDEGDQLGEMNEQYDLVAQDYRVGDGPDNLLFIGTGIGDGGYPIYWGLASNGEPAALVVSFYLLEARFRKNLQ
ncbi:DUF4241 domain-containing protein [Mesorhizobium sp. VNQ89]|uniref:DUF4241 domain-containing protein n=1 Tax=Mesorhizobium quangtriensis TaxID=3157709 RepID=UPI0032B7FAF1